MPHTAPRSSPLAFVVPLLPFLVAAAAAHAARAGDVPASSWAPDTPEAGSVEDIRRFTTDAKYLPASVGYVPASATVPSPKKVLGQTIGAPGVLHGTADVYRYFRALDAASDRVRVVTLGRSEEGREIIMAVIADEAGLADLDRLQRATARLADPRTCDAAAMDSLVRIARPIYYLNGGLHSPETGSPEMLMELAYRLAVSERPEIRRIRERTVVLVNPVSEPDGRDRVVEWYDRFLKGRVHDYRVIDVMGDPPYWGHYAYHDNNRDGIQLTLALTRAVNEMYWDWHPTVIHDLHESIPLLYIMMGTGPYSEAVDPVTVAEWSQFAYHEAGKLQAQGLPGVWTWGFWDGWWPGYLFSVANNHNSIGRFYETFGNLSAETFDRKLKDVKYVGRKITDPAWYRTWPPDATVTWSLRDNTNYMEAGVLAALEYASLHGEEMLRNFWTKGRRALDRGRTEKPYAWAFPAAQRDPSALAYLVNQLRVHHIEVHRADSAFTVSEGSWPAGTYLVRMEQPYRNAAVNFLTEQRFPADEPNPPYDDVAWTLPLLYGVEGKRVDDPAIHSVPASLVREPVAVPGEVRGDGPVFLLADTGQEPLLAARVALGGRAVVEAAEEPFEAGGARYPAGSWIVRGGSVGVARLRDVARTYGLSLVSARAVPPVRKHLLDLPRLGVYHTWTSTQDCGWVRYTFDHERIPYTLLSDGDLRKGGLGGRFDMILIPNSGGSFTDMVRGIDRKYGPLPYERTAATPSHGIPDASPDITGGMGFAGLANLEAFVRGGGVLVTLANAGTLPIQGGFAREVRPFSGSGLFTPGSEVRAKFTRPAHPIAYGYPDTISIFRGNGPLFQVDEEDEGLVVLQFGAKDKDEEPPATGASASAAGGTAPASAARDTAKAAAKGEKKTIPFCLSGLVKGEDQIERKPAILDVPVGRGRLLLFAFNPLHRFLNRSDFRLAMNAILNWNDLRRAVGGGKGHTTVSSGAGD